MIKTLHPSRAGTSCKRITSILLALGSWLFVLPPVFAQLNLVKDINTTPTGSTLLDHHYSRFTYAGGKLYFVVKETELWSSSVNGLQARLIKVFLKIDNLTNVEGTLFLAADNGGNGIELWKSEGTTETTVLVKDIWPGVGSSDPSNLTNVNGILYFSANDGSTGRELWKSNGTAAGTQRVKDIMRVRGSSNPGALVAMSGLLFFVVNDGQHGYELWKSDGTPVGTAMVKDITPARRTSSRVSQLTNVNGTLFFTATEPSGKRTLWKTDGSQQGTTRVTDLLTRYKQLTAVNNTLFFSADDAIHGDELWKTDGTPEGTVLVKDITPGPTSGSPYEINRLDYLEAAGDHLFFLARAGARQPKNVWVSNGEEGGTMAITEFSPGELGFFDPLITSFKEWVYFTAQHPRFGRYIYRTNGEVRGEALFLAKSSQQLTVAENFLYYVTEGRLWRTDGENHFAIQGVGIATEGSDPVMITDADGIVYFGAFDGTSHGLWKSDGTAQGTTLMKR
ncbi:MAG: ELWxxDGT repeat protein, partial [Chryseosolibacter sp.]